MIKIDISEIKSKHIDSLRINMDIDPMNLEHEIMGLTLKENIKLEADVEYMVDTVLLDGTLTGKYLASCGRCLIDVLENFEIEIHERFQLESETKSDESYLIKGNQIELSQVINDNILLSIPTVILCDENCKGLCSQCGHNLNKDKCSCETQGTNLKMEILKDYFKNK